MNGVAIAEALDAAPWGQRQATAHRLAVALGVSVATIYQRAQPYRAATTGRAQPAGLWDGPSIAATLALCPIGMRVKVAARLARAYGCSVATIYRRAQPHLRKYRRAGAARRGG